MPVQRRIWPTISKFVPPKEASYTNIGSVSDLVFSEKDNGALVQVPRGSKMTIELREDPTKRCRWELDNSDELFLACEGDAFLTGDQIGLGAGGVRRFFFRAKGSGCTSLSLIQKRASASGSEATGSFKLALQIVK
jgi:predicted secreted protein